MGFGDDRPQHAVLAFYVRGNRSALFSRAFRAQGRSGHQRCPGQCQNQLPEFEDFLDDSDDESLAQFILARRASFSNLKLRNQTATKQFVSDSVEESVAKLVRQLDQDDEDRVAILTAPAPLAGFAVLRYASERILKSAPENIQELREKGFLP